MTQQTSQTAAMPKIWQQPEARRQPVITGGEDGPIIRAFIALAFIMTSSTFYDAFAGSAAGTIGGTLAPDALAGEVSARDNPVYLIMWGTLYAATLLGLLKTIMRHGVNPALLYAAPMIVLVFSSMGWSVSAKTSAFYGLMLTLNILLAYVLSQIVTPRFLLRQIAILLIICLVISLFLLIVAPQLVSVTRYGGGWLSNSQLYGVFSHKSDAGYYFAILALLMSQGQALGFSRSLRLVTLAATLLAVVLTNSATGLLSTIFATALLWFFRGKNLLSSVAFAASAAAVIIFSVAVPYINLGAVVELIGRDAGLTGRSEIWPLAIEYIQQRPLLGFGYYGFFDKDIFSPLWELYEHFKYFFTPHFHNSAIDTTISLGLVGLALYIAYLAMAYSIGANRTIELQTRRLVFGVLLILTITTCFDFTMMKHNSFATTFLFYSFFAAQTHYDRL